MLLEDVPRDESVCRVERVHTTALRAPERAAVAADLVVLAAVARGCEVLIEFEHALLEAGRDCRVGCLAMLSARSAIPIGSLGRMHGSGALILLKVGRNRAVAHATIGSRWHRQDRLILLRLSYVKLLPIQKCTGSTSCRLPDVMISSLP